MYKNLAETIKGIIDVQNVNEECKTILQPLIDYVQRKTHSEADIALNFICTHNSRRSHLAQVYAERSLQIATEMFYVFSMIKSYRCNPS